MRVGDQVRRPGVTIEADATIHQAARLMEEQNLGSLVVVDGGSPVGIVTDRDLVRRGLAHALAPDARVDGVMSSPVVSIDAEEDATVAFRTFRNHPIRRLVVTEADAVHGVLTVDDLVINLSSQLADIARPVTAETVFGHRDPSVPAIG